MELFEVVGVVEDRAVVGVVEFFVAGVVVFVQEVAGGVDVDDLVAVAPLTTGSVGSFAT